MQPNNSNPSPQPPSQFNSNDYDFILKSNAPKKTFLIGGSQTKTIIIFLSIVFLLIGVVLIGITMFSNNNNPNEPLVKITQQQNEIIRIANSSNGKVRSSEAKQLATNSSLVITTDQKALIAYLAKQKRKVSQKELILTRNKKTDSLLTEADKNDRYDETFLQIMYELLNEYQKSLTASYNNVGKNGQEILSQSFNNVTLIISNKPQKQ